MFVAKDKETGARVTSLDPVWRSRDDALRALTNSGQVVCPGCMQALRFRVGGRCRPHFAHRKLSECPLSRQSPEVLEAKAQLYEWLYSKYPGKVEMDVDLNVPEWECPADLVVRPDVKKVFSYWVFDRTPRNRAPLVQYVSINETAHVLYTGTSRKLSEEGDALLLAAALRDFIRRSLFDGQRELGHLCFLDTERHQVLIYRGLECVHLPNCYGWDIPHELDWPACKISPRTGEIVAAGEKERKREPVPVFGESEWRSKPSPVDMVREDATPLQNFAPPRERSITLADLAKAARADNPPRREPPVPSNERTQFSAAWVNRPLECEFCGKSTTDYIVAQLGLGTCTCRECHSKSIQARLGNAERGDS